MRLFQREIREILLTATIAAGLVLIIGWVFQSAARSGYIELVRSFEMIRFIICISLCSIFGAMTYGSDRERGTDRFLDTLPIPIGAIFAAKTTAGLLCVGMIFGSYYSVSTSSVMSQWWPMLLLGFAIGQFFGLDLGHSIHASTLSVAIGLALISGLSGAPIFSKYVGATISALLLISTALFISTRLLAGRLNK